MATKHAIYIQSRGNNELGHHTHSLDLKLTIKRTTSILSERVHTLGKECSQRKQQGNLVLNEVSDSSSINMSGVCENLTKEMLERMPESVKMVLMQDLHRQLVIKAERKLLRIGYKLYNYHELPKDVKDKLDRAPDICAESDRKWVFVEVSIMRILQ